MVSKFIYDTLSQVWIAVLVILKLSRENSSMCTHNVSFIVIIDQQFMWDSRG